MLLCLLATAQAATPARTTPAAAKPQLLPAEAWDRIRTGRVHVERDLGSGDLTCGMIQAHPLPWRDVALTNNVSLLDALTAVEDQLSVLKALIASGDGEELERYFAICRSVRREHDRVLNPLDPSAGAQVTEDANKGRDLS